jgi:hypothetical protein
MEGIKPFRQLCDLSRFASSLVYNQIRPPRVCWNQEVTMMTVDGESFSLDSLRAGLRVQLDALRSSILDITGEERICDWLSVYAPV